MTIVTADDEVETISGGWLPSMYAVPSPVHRKKSNWDPVDYAIAPVDDDLEPMTSSARMRTGVTNVGPIALSAFRCESCHHQCLYLTLC